MAIFFIDGAHDDGWRVAAWGAFAIASVTDRIDGDIARRRGLVTDFGKVADPIADKALTGAALISLSIVHELPWWVTVVILAREIGVTLLRFWVIRHGVIAASRGGKLKTLLQGVSPRPVRPAADRLAARDRGGRHGGGDRGHAGHRCRLRLPGSRRTPGRPCPTPAMSPDAAELVARLTGRGETAGGRRVADRRPARRGVHRGAGRVRRLPRRGHRLRHRAQGRAARRTCRRCWPRPGRRRRGSRPEWPRASAGCCSPTGHSRRPVSPGRPRRTARRSARFSSAAPVPTARSCVQLALAGDRGEIRRQSVACGPEPADRAARRAPDDRHGRTPRRWCRVPEPSAEG